MRRLEAAIEELKESVAETEDLEMILLYQNQGGFSVIAMTEMVPREILTVLKDAYRGIYQSLPTPLQEMEVPLDDTEIVGLATENAPSDNIPRLRKGMVVDYFGGESVQMTDEMGRSKEAPIARILFGDALVDEASGDDGQVH